MRTLRHHRRDRGVILPLFALFLTTIIVMVAFAVDLGRLRAERRDVQADADAIALDAVQAIQGLTADAALPVAITEANASAARNDFPATLTDSEVSVGTWNVQTQELCPGTVTNGVCDDTVLPTDYFPDAVQVDLTSSIPMFFDFSADERSVHRTGVAVARAQTMGELGSVTAGIEPQNPFAGCAVGAAASAQMTYMNHIYTKLLGIEAEVENEGEIDGEVDENINCNPLGPDDGLKLDVGSYQGIASSRVRLRDLAANMGFASTEALLASDVTQKEVLTATADALDNEGNVAGVTMGKIAAQTTGSSTFRFGDRFSSSTGNGESAAEASMNALDILLMTATAIDGNNFLGASNDLILPTPLLANVADVQSRVSVIEPPIADEDWRNPGQEGPRTSQVYLTLDVPVSFTSQPLDLPSSLLGLPGVSVTGSVTGAGTVPIVVEVGAARTSYPNIQCGPGGVTDSVVTWEVLTAAVRGSIGLLADGEYADDATVQAPSGPLLNGTADLTISVGGIPLGASLDLGELTTVPVIDQAYESGSALDVDGEYYVSAGGGTEYHDFVPPYPTDPAYRFRGGIYGLSMSDSLVASHTWGTAATGTLGGLLTGGQSGVIRDQVIKSTLSPVMQEFDQFVLDPLLDALGVTAGGADGKNLAVRCQVPALANRG